MNPILDVERYSGKRLELLRIVVTAMDGRMDVRLDGRINGERLCFYCENAHGLCLDKLSAPAVIEGFEIQDNRSRGWQADTRFCVNDYEDGQLKLYCEKIYTI